MEKQKEHASKKTNLAISLALLIIIAFTAFFVFKNYIRSQDKHDVLQQKSIQWLEAVMNGNMRSALNLANQICPVIPKGKPSDLIVSLFEKHGISKKFINAKYNKWDFIYWKNSLFFLSMAKSLTSHIRENNYSKIVETLLNAVHNRIKPVPLPEESVPWPYTTWHQKKGLCDQQAWLFAELVYQLGFETQVVYLYDTETKSSPHTICEIRKGRRVWTADPYSGILLKNISVEELSNAPKLKQKIWAKEPSWQNAINTPIFYIPAYPQAYKPGNQQLHTRLARSLDQYCPRFGEPPLVRQKKYLSLAKNYSKKYTCKLWFYPFRLLHYEMANN